MAKLLQYLKTIDLTTSTSQTFIVRSYLKNRAATNQMLFIFAE